MSFPETTQIVTPRLRVRHVGSDDLELLMDVNGDDEVTRYLPYHSWQTIEDARAWLLRTEEVQQAGTGRQFVIERLADSVVIGVLVLFRFEEDSARVELGYALGRAYWRHGYASEAIRAVCTYAFSKLGIRRIEAEVDPDNAASNDLLLSVGFSHEGCLRKRWVSKDKAHDTNIYGLLSDDSLL